MRSVFKSPILYLAIPVTIFSAIQLLELMSDHDEDAAAAITFALFLLWLAVPLGAGKKITVRAACIWMSTVFSLITPFMLGNILDSIGIFGTEIYVSGEDVTSLIFLAGMIMVYTLLYWGYKKIRKSEERFRLRGRRDYTIVILAPLIGALVVTGAIRLVESRYIAELAKEAEEAGQILDLEAVFKQEYLDHLDSLIADLKNNEWQRSSTVFESKLLQHFSAAEGGERFFKLEIFPLELNKGDIYLPLWSNQKNRFFDNAEVKYIGSEEISTDFRRINRQDDYLTNGEDRRIYIQRRNDRAFAYVYNRQMVDTRNGLSWSFNLIIWHEDLVNALFRYNAVIWADVSRLGIMESSSSMSPIGHDDEHNMDFYISPYASKTLYANIPKRFSYINEPFWVGYRLAGGGSAAGYYQARETMLAILLSLAVFAELLLIQFLQYRK